MILRQTPHNLTYLHIWREHNIYEMIQNLKKAEDWNNLRFSVYPYPDTALVQTMDIRNGLPHPANSFDAILTTRLIEHLTLDENRVFLQELFRVLRPGGVVRFSTPDLNAKVDRYLQKVEEYQAKPTEENVHSYFWSVLELTDQCTRSYSGGLLMETARSGKVSAEDMRATAGDVFDYLLGKRERNKPLKSMRQNIGYAILRKLQRWWQGGHPKTTREANMWIYDDLYLENELQRAGFADVQSQQYKTSDIPHYHEYAFDTSPHGDYVVEPSLFMEAKKPR